MERIALDGADAGGVDVDLPLLGHGPEGGSDLRHLLRSSIEGHDGSTPAGELIGMPAEAASEVEDKITRGDLECVVVGSEHQSNSIGLGRGSPLKTAS